MKTLAIFLGLAVVAALHLFLPWETLAEVWRRDPSIATTLLVELRLPRTLLVLTYGTVLGAAGAAMQAVFANPLASPDLTGASSGAALGAIVGSYWLGLTAPLAMAACGALGAALALAGLFALAGRLAETTTLLLAGVAMSIALGSLATLCLALAPSPFAFYDAYDWLMGSFVDRSLLQALVAAIPAGAALAFLATKRRPLDLLALGDDVAAATGVSPARLTRQVMIATAVGIGACVSVAGSIGFVGLVAPYFARHLTKGHPGRAIVPAALIGAAAMTAADLLSRAIPLDRPIPVGVVTALLGTPLFLWLVVSMRRRVTA